MGHADFRVAGRVFASLDKEERIGSMKLPLEDQARFVGSHPDAVSPANGAWGAQGWTKIVLAAADEELVGEALTLACELVRRGSTAPSSKRQVSTAPRSRSTRSASAPRAAASRPGAREVDAYIAACPTEVQPLLERIRATVRSVAPDAEETISYRMPAFFLDGALIYYAPFKKHIGLFPPVKGDAAMNTALAPYRGPKGNLQFPLDKKMPFGLIKRVVQARVREQREARAKRRR
ncbi:MAG: DUF1801 domain-containing protein [Vicinamibacterales bacterium]